MGSDTPRRPPSDLSHTYTDGPHLSIPLFVRDDRDSGHKPTDSPPGRISIAGDGEITAPGGRPVDSADEATAAVDEPRLIDQAREVARSGLGNLLWTAAEVVGMHFTPLTPVLLRTVYLAEELVTAFDGLTSGRGFVLKLSAFSLAIGDGSPLSGVDLPVSVELVGAVRIGAREPRENGAIELSAETQIFKPWFDQMDIERSADTGATEQPAPSPTDSITPRPDDPFAVWLQLLGQDLITDLAETLKRAPNAAYGQEIDPRGLF